MYLELRSQAIQRSGETVPGREKSKYQSSEADWLHWLCRFCRIWYSQNLYSPKDLGSIPGLGKSSGDEVLNEEVTWADLYWSKTILDATWRLNFGQGNRSRKVVTVLLWEMLVAWTRVEVMEREVDWIWVLPVMPIRLSDWLIECGRSWGWWKRGFRDPSRSLI